MKSIEKPLYDIRGLIYVVRNQQVMFDSDLAILYQVETKVLNQSVKRNIQRFPEEFRFQLTESEYLDLRSQFVTFKVLGDSDVKKAGRKYLPYVFTEQGIAMLSAVLRSDVAIKTSISIMNTFQKIFFDGQIYDAFGLIISLIQKAKDKIILIDGYVDIGTLNLFSKKKGKVTITIYTHEKTKLNDMDVTSFNSQYPLLEVKYTEKFHDRFLIIDGEEAYHIGASLKDAGKKCFGINLIEDRGVLEEILRRLGAK